MTPVSQSDWTGVPACLPACMHGGMERVDIVEAFIQIIAFGFVTFEYYY